MTSSAPLPRPLSRFRFPYAALLVAALAAGCTMLGRGEQPTGARARRLTDDEVTRTEPIWYLRADVLDLDQTSAKRLSKLSVDHPEAEERLGFHGLPAVIGPGTEIVGHRMGSPVQADAWTGIQSVGVWESRLDSAWPRDGFDFRWTGQIHPIANYQPWQWMEVALLTVDEATDYFEPAYVYGADGRLTLGLDFLAQGGEVTWIASRVLPDPHGVHDYRLRVDASRAKVDVWIDGRPWLSETLVDHHEPSRRAPFRIISPPRGHLIQVGRASTGIASAELRGIAETGIVFRFDASAVDGSDRWWPSISAGISGPLQTPAIVASWTGWHRAPGPDIFDVAADASASWMFRGRVFPVAAPLDGSWLGTGGKDTWKSPGWALSTALGAGWAYAMVLRDGHGEVKADAGSVPEGDQTTIAVLDRQTSQLRLYVNAELAATTAAGQIGAIDATDGVSIFPGPAAGTLESAAIWNRALTGAEIELLSAR